MPGGAARRGAAAAAAHAAAHVRGAGAARAQRPGLPAAGLRRRARRPARRLPRHLAPARQSLPHLYTPIPSPFVLDLV